MNQRSGMWNRRRFIQTTGSLAALCASESKWLVAARPTGVTLVVDPTDTVAGSPPCIWAAKELERTLSAQHITVTRASSVASTRAGDVCVVLASASLPVAMKVFQKTGTPVSNTPESLGIVAGTAKGRKAVLATGSDIRGLTYATLELADRVDCSESPLDGLMVDAPVLERPANKLRSINRCFQSSLEDTPWFEDKTMWSAYLTMLASNRFNMFNLSMGLGYDYPQKVSDSYTYFTYPFFVSVPGYERVRAGNLSDAQRDKNLGLLRFISDECAVRGLDFTLGLWNHAYVMSPGSTPTYPIEGLTPETHAPYCRDALYALLKACPSITGLTMRVHGESGIPEGKYEFWEVVFQGIARLDRKISVNLHAKGTSKRIIDIAQSTKMPVSLTPKYWAEHLGLSYQPASIRETEKPPKGPDQTGALFELSNGARRFMRYSYGDLFKKNRTYDVYFRIWPGTQRVLMWGDPKLAAGDGRGFSMCGSLGVDLFEPLSFKGRGGSGVSSAAGGRCSYADESLAPKHDWDKFSYSYRVWGRHIYNPDSDPSACHRYWDKQLQMAGPSMAHALAIASRILRIVTTSQLPSAANWTYWPEMYTNETIVDPKLNTLYKDNPEPHVYETTSPLDPQMFSAIDEAVEDILKGRSNSRYSPMEVSGWLENYASIIDTSLAEAQKRAHNSNSPVYRRVALDVQIQSGLGKFFSAKIRGAALFAVYQTSSDPAALSRAVEQYTKAREAWASLASAAKGTYMNDVTYGKVPNMRGHWMDRLPAIEADIQALRDAPKITPSDTVSEQATQEAIRQILSPLARPEAACQHTPAASFRVGTRLRVEIKVSPNVTGVRMKYRHVNQAEYYETVDMTLLGGAYHAEIPAEYTQSEYALQYYFELQHSPTQATMHPGLGPDLTDRPYFLLEQV